MTISQEELHDLVVDTVQRFAGGGMERRRIIDRVEGRLKVRGAWEPSDDAWSESTDPKTIGRAAIDWAITELKQTRRLEHLARNRWGVPQRPPKRRPFGIALQTNALRWAIHHPQVHRAAQAILDENARDQFLVSQYYSSDVKK